MRPYRVILALIVGFVIFLYAFSFGQCPEDPEDFGSCDTFSFHTAPMASTDAIDLTGLLVNTDSTVRIPVYYWADDSIEGMAIAFGFQGTNCDKFHIDSVSWVRSPGHVQQYPEAHKPVTIWDTDSMVIGILSLETNPLIEPTPGVAAILFDLWLTIDTTEICHVVIDSSSTWTVWGVKFANTNIQSYNPRFYKGVFKTKSYPSYSGPVWYVSTTGDDSTGDGSEQFPFRTIQKGIESASHGDTVLVEKGRYVENTNFLGKAILVASYFIFDGLESTIDSTIIDGDSLGSVVTFESGEDSNSIIQGFTITGGYASSNYGGGIYCTYTSPVIKDNVITGNLAAERGGGIYCEFGYPIIENNIISNNQALVVGGGMYIPEFVQSRILGNTIEDNHAGMHGGGLFLHIGSGGMVKNNVFIRNSAGELGGAIILSAVGDILVSNNTIVDCSAGSGGGICLWDLSSPCTLVNNIIVNSASGYGIWAQSPTSSPIVYNDVWNNVPANFSGCTYGVGCISEDPLFVNPSVDDYHLTLGSPCIDAGDPTDPVPPGGGARIDMGAFELVQPPYSGPVWYISTSGDDATGDGSEQFPFWTIQKGIESASNGDTVLVEKGWYVENINFLGKAILVASYFIFDGLESTIDSTIIDGDSLGSMVTFESGEDSNSVIQGFTLTRGHATYGGAIYCNSSSPIIMNNFLVGNSCEPAKGGAAIYCGHGAKAKIIRNLIVNNLGPSGITVYIDSDVEIINNTISENSWGGIAVQSNSRALITNNIITNNISYGILVREDCYDTDIAYNDVWGDQENYDIISDQTGTNGNISEDPLYQASELGDYHLSSGSPCIDAGDPSFPVPPGGGIRIDMGVFEFVRCIHPHHFVFTDNTGDTYSIVIDSAFLHGLELEECDEIGVFDDTGGGMLCVGASVYHPADLPIPLIAWKDDPLTPEEDGYTPGHAMYFKVWSRNQDGEKTAVAHYSVGDGHFESGVYSQLWLEVSLPCEEIPLYSNWQWISTNIDPDPFEMESIFVDCWSALDIIIAGDGSFCIPDVGCWIPGWNVLEMYKIHMKEACTIQICGSKVLVDSPISLGEGYNSISYLPDCPLEPGTALSSIWSKLDVVKNDDGEFCIPNVGCWIKHLEPSEGYKAHLSSAGTLVYPTSCPSYPPLLVEENSFSGFAKTSHFVYLGKTGESYSVVVNSVELDGKFPEDGNEIGIFTPSGLCVGAGVWQSEKTGLAAWEDDPLTETIDGYEIGEKMVFKLWDKSEGKEIDLVVSNQTSDLRFGDGPYAIINLKAEGSVSSIPHLPASFFLSQNYPNPFNPETEIGFALPKDCKVKLVIYNILGEKVRTLVDADYKAGNHTIHWDGTSDSGEMVASGLYFYKMAAGNYISTKKMVLAK